MRRFLFWFMVALAAIWLLKSSRREHGLTRNVLVHTAHVRVGHGSDSPRRIVAIENGHGETITVVDEDHDEDHDSGEHAQRVVIHGGDGKVLVDGLPVPVVPGTRVTQAHPEPPAPPKPPALPRPLRARVTIGSKQHPAARTDKKVEKPKTESKVEPLVIAGRLSATEDRAREDARRQLVKELARRLGPEVPDTWRIPDDLIDGMIREVRVEPHERDYGTMYDATLTVDFSPESRAEIIDAHTRDRTVGKLWLLGGGLAFVLALLGTVSGYIRADEATKGYYTNRLRVAAAAGVGAAGVLVYRWLA